MSRKLIGFGIVGYGGMGSYHANQLISNESEIGRVIGAYDIDDKRQEKTKEDGYKVFSDYNELLNDEEIEAVIVATPNDSHKYLSIKALRAGKHVICEKPVTMNVEEFDEILKVADDEELVFMVHQNRRWDPDFLLVLELMKSKAIGDVFQIESRVHGANGIPGDWRREKEHGGGMLLDWGVHLIDQIFWSIDSPIKNINTDLSYILGNEVDDGFTVSITFENGVRSVVEVGTTNFISLPRWYLKGDKGTALIKDWDLNGSMVVSTEAETIEQPTPIQAGIGLTKTMAPPVEGMTKEVDLPEIGLSDTSFYQNFYDVLRKDSKPIVKNKEVRKVMVLIDTILDNQSK